MSRVLASDPLRSFKFLVCIPRNDANIPAGMMRLGFMSATGINLQTTPITYREGGDNVTPRKMPGQTDSNPITLSRGLFPMDYDQWYWFRNIFQVEYGRGLFNGTNDFRSDWYLQVLAHPNNSGGSAVTGPQSTSTGTSFYTAQNLIAVSYKFFSSWPAQLAFSDFDAGSNAAAMSQMVLMNEGFDIHFAAQADQGKYLSFSEATTW